MRAKRVDRHWDGVDYTYYGKEWEDKKSMSDQLKEDVDAYIASGGSIEHCAYGARTMSLVEGDKNPFPYALRKQKEH